MTRSEVIDQLGIDLDDDGFISTLDRITGKNHKLMRDIEKLVIKSLWDGNCQLSLDVFNAMVDAAVDNEKRKAAKQ